MTYHLQPKKRGRPRDVDYSEVYKLYDEGFTRYKIRVILGVSYSSVHWAIKRRENENRYKAFTNSKSD